MALDVETTFPSHLAFLKAQFCHLKIIVPFKIVVGPLLDSSSLFDQQASFFMLTMKTNNLGALHPP
jgi:hypothetical protein